MRFSRILFLSLLWSTAVTAESAPPIRRGAAEYKGACIACHQADGKGIPAVYPPLAGSDWVRGSERRLAAILLYGLTGPITVNDTTYPGLPMPAFREGSSFNWSDAKIADVLTYIRTEWDNKAAPVEASTISKIRKEIRERSEMTEAELQAIN